MRTLFNPMNILELLDLSYHCSHRGVPRHLKGISSQGCWMILVGCRIDGDWFSTQGHATAHREADEEMRGWELVIPLIGRVNGGSMLREDRDIRHKEAEYGYAIYCNATNSGPLWAVRSEAGGVGVLAVVGIGQFKFGGGEEEVSVGIGRRGGDNQGWGNAPGNDEGSGMRAGV